MTVFCAQINGSKAKNDDILFHFQKQYISEKQAEEKNMSATQPKTGSGFILYELKHEIVVTEVGPGTFLTLRKNENTVMRNMGKVTASVFIIFYGNFRNCFEELKLADARFFNRTVHFALVHI